MTESQKRKSGPGQSESQNAKKKKVSAKGRPKLEGMSSSGKARVHLLWQEEALGPKFVRESFKDAQHNSATKSNLDPIIEPFTMYPQPTRFKLLTKYQGGNRGKWQTPHQKAKIQALNVQQGTVEPGDMGVWVSCARGMEMKAAREVKDLFEEYAEKIYDIKPPVDEKEAAGSDDEEEDIEASIKKELTGMKPGKRTPSEQDGKPPPAFTVVRQHVSCLLFVKTRDPIDPVKISHRICSDAAAASSPLDRKGRYLNRLTPISVVGRATEKGVAEVCGQVLAPWFKLKKTTTAAQDGEDGGQDASAAAENGGGDDDDSKPAYSFAIRLSTRNNCPLSRDDVIKQIASMIDPQHKVDLGSPDKVILVDMFQTIFGASVVDGDWDKLKRYNITELYNNASSSSASNDNPKKSKNGADDHTNDKKNGTEVPEKRNISEEGQKQEEGEVKSV